MLQGSQPRNGEQCGVEMLAVPSHNPVKPFPGLLWEITLKIAEFCSGVNEPNHYILHANKHCFGEQVRYHFLTVTILLMAFKTEPISLVHICVFFITGCKNIYWTGRNRTARTSHILPCYNITLQWRHNERDDVSNHQPHDCLLKRLFRRRSKNAAKLHVTGLCGHRWIPLTTGQ